MNKLWAFNGLCKKDFTCTDGATRSELHPCQTRFYLLKKIETNHQKVWRLLFFSFINILDPLHKQSCGIHPVIFNSSFCKFFSCKPVLCMKSLQLCECGLVFLLQSTSSRWKLQPEGILFTPALSLWNWLHTDATGLCTVSFSHTSERRKTGIEIFGMKGLYLCLWLCKEAECTAVLFCGLTFEATQSS